MGYQRRVHGIYFFIRVIFLTFILRLLLLILGNLFSKANLFNLEKISPFECGFDPKFNARLPFTMRIFLIFDVELVLIFPFLIKLNYLRFFYFLIIIIIFTFILFLGLIHE